MIEPRMNNFQNISQVLFIVGCQGVVQLEVLSPGYP